MPDLSIILLFFFALLILLTVAIVVSFWLVETLASSRGGEPGRQTLLRHVTMIIVSSMFFFLFAYVFVHDVKLSVWSAPTVCAGGMLLFGWQTIAAALRTVRTAQTLVRRRFHRPGTCPTCGYDLRATPDRCPECGHTEDEDPFLRAD